jgi:sterol desaturase/sphingolipid hydroxylase (fatty acid hydroxylase superfamily)
MMQWLLQHEIAVRAGSFAGVFALLAIVQMVWPFRRVDALLRRWARHLSIVALGTALVRIAFPLAAIAVAAEVEASRFGILQMAQLSKLPFALEVLAGVLILDLAIYLQHRIFHRVPWLWRLHRMHHSDTEFELSTAIRFHPLEIALSMLIKILVVVICGIPALAVLLFEILLNATALFSHTDISLPARLDRGLRRVLVTPDMHRIHHSVIPLETNSNFGFCLSWWDRLFDSYRAHAVRDPAHMPIGLERFRETRDQRLWALLRQPFDRER